MAKKTKEEKEATKRVKRFRLACGDDDIWDDGKKEGDEDSDPDADDALERQALRKPIERLIPPIDRKRKRHVKLKITEDVLRLVELTASFGLPLDKIGQILGVTGRSLIRHKKKSDDLSDAYERGRAAGLLHFAENLRQQSDRGNVAATIFYLKCQGHWRAPVEIEFDPIDTANKIREAVARAHASTEGGPSFDIIEVKADITEVKADAKKSEG